MPADGAEKGECSPDDVFLTSVRLHAIAPRHIRVSPYPDGDRCKAASLISTSENLNRTTEFGRGFYYLSDIHFYRIVKFEFVFSEWYFYR